MEIYRVMNNIIALPKITVITVTYNGEETLENTITSVLNQTYKNIEYIIVDGESNDSTLEIIKKYDSIIWIDGKCYDEINHFFYIFQNKSYLNI